jgi:exodeoxyribonuclease VII large subunit
MLPQRIGIVTSPTGAAIRDMINILTRRFPNLHVSILPVRVQGSGAAEEIAAAIDLFNALKNIDVMIVGRGGGSLEDLWSFNEEVVARAIARSKIPTISAVGHEIDFTIADFVADLRAPTPSAAAELVVQSKAVLEDTIRGHARHLAAALENKLLAMKNRYTRVARSYVFREPQNLAKNYRQRIESHRDKLGSLLRGSYTQKQQLVDELGMRLGHRMEVSVQEFRRRIEKTRDRLSPALLDARTKKQQRVGELAMRLGHKMEVVAQAKRQQLQRLESQLRALGPLAVLDRGYSITQTADGKVVRDPAQVKPGDRLKTRVAKGGVESEVI